MKLLISISVLFLFACKSAKTSNIIVYENLISFIVRPDVRLTDEVSYFFFNNEDDFRKIFTLTKGSPGNIVIPDFNTQRVLAIAIKPTKEIFEIKMLKTEISGNNLNVFYTQTPTTGTSFLHTPFILASITTPKSIMRVNFYNGKTKEKVIEMDSN